MYMYICLTLLYYYIIIKKTFTHFTRTQASYIINFGKMKIRNSII